jgi:CHAT domain-containing protein
MLRGKAATNTRGLLLVGGVDFDAASPGAAADTSARRNSRSKASREQIFQSLGATSDEIASISELYQKHSRDPVLKFSGQHATEQALREALPRTRFVHLATHGFFALADLRLREALFTNASPTLDPASDGSAVLAVTGDRLIERRARLVRFHPGLLSAVALAGANRPQAGGDDGLLTAVELADLDLDGNELFVLSACESALGEPAGGEGLLGLERALHVAGARTVVASLWKVDDLATQALMQEFYRNLWDEKLPKLEALRRAQLTLIRHYDPKTGRLRAGGKISSGDPETLKRTQQGLHPRYRSLPPHYWAGFVLSGDWR